MPSAVRAGPLGIRVWPAITILLAAMAMVAPAKVSWDGAGVGVGGGRLNLCVWLPTTRNDELREITSPPTVMAGSVGLRVVPSTMMALEAMAMGWWPIVM